MAANSTWTMAMRRVLTVGDGDLSYSLAPRVPVHKSS